MRDHLAPDRLGHGLRGQRHRADALPTLSERGLRVRHRGQEKLGNAVDRDTRVDFGGCFVDLPREQLRQTQSTAELCGHRRSGRCAKQHVGFQQCPRGSGRLIGDAEQNAGLPGDSGYTAAAEHQCTCGHRTVGCSEA